MKTWTNTDKIPFGKKQLGCLIVAVLAMQGASAQTQSAVDGSTATSANVTAEAAVQGGVNADVDTDSIVDSLQSNSEAILDVAAQVTADVESNSEAAVNSMSENATESTSELDITALLSGNSDSEALVDWRWCRRES